MPLNVLSFLNGTAYSDAAQFMEACDPAKMNIKAFLNTLKYFEHGGNTGNEVYYIRNGGSRIASLQKHPGCSRGRGGTSSASGAYQFTCGTWAALQLKLSLPDFSPASQDKAAVAKIHERGALKFIEAGNITAACAKLRNEWSSLPGGREPQGSINTVKQVFESFGGTVTA